MWKLTPPDTNSLREELHEALTLRDGTPVYALSESEKESLICLYEVYDQKLGRASEELEAKELGERLRNAMYDAYSQVQVRGRLKRLRDQIKSLATVCPYCGFGEIKDLDHHLPRSKYKVLAIYPKNLVPSCGPCNNKKRAVADDEPNGQFFHTYLDTVPEVIFFIANAKLENGALEVTFSVDAEALPEDVYQRMAFQIDRMELNIRYKAAISTYLSSQLTAFEMVYGVEGGSEKLKRFLLSSANSEGKIYGNNDWRPALMRGLAICSEFCNGGFRKALGAVIPGA